VTHVDIKSLTEEQMVLTGKHIFFSFLYCLRLVYPIYVASFSGLSIFDCPFCIL